MAEQEIGRAVIAMRSVFDSEKGMIHEFNFYNMGIPIEIILMQLKAYLEQQKQEYFELFENNNPHL